MSNNSSQSTGTLISAGPLLKTPLMETILPAYKWENDSDCLEGKMYVADAGDVNLGTIRDLIQDNKDLHGIESIFEAREDDPFMDEVVDALANALGADPAKVAAFKTRYSLQDDYETVNIGFALDFLETMGQAGNLVRHTGMGAYWCDRERLDEFGGYAEVHSTRMESSIGTHYLKDQLKAIDEQMAAGNNTAAGNALAKPASLISRGILDDRMRLEVLESAAAELSRLAEELRVKLEEADSSEDIAPGCSMG